MQEIVTWTKTMAFKPSKCTLWAGRFFRNGEKTKFTKLQNSTYDPLLTVNGDAILCVGQDTKSDFMFKILSKVNTISLSGCIKSWIVDNVVVSRFSWTLLIYDFPLSGVQNWSNRCSNYLLQKMAENEQMCRNFNPFHKSTRNFWIRI